MKVTISKEDVQYLFKIEESLAVLADRLVAISLAKDEAMFDIRNLRAEKAKFMDQIYTKYNIDKTKQVQVDTDTGEVNIPEEEN